MIFDIVYLPLLAFATFFYFFWLGVFLLRRKEIFGEKELTIGSPLVSIVIPAYNKAKYVKQAIYSAEASDYPRKEIIIVNDNSTDNTEDILSEFGDYIRVIRPDKRLGKAAALNLGIESAGGDVIVTLDADTFLEKNCLRKIVAHLMADEKVGAVTPSCGIANPKKIMEFVQELQHAGFTFIRKKQEALRSTFTIFGPVIAVRKELLRRIGGFDGNVLSEDFDLAVRINKAGYKVKTLASAMAWTVPCDSLGSFWRQRLRWHRGGLQVLRKHSRLLVERSWHGFYLSTALLTMVFQAVGFIAACLLGLFSLFASSPMNPSSISFVIGTAITAAVALDFVFALRLVNLPLRNIIFYPALFGYLIFEGLIILVAAAQELFGTQKRW